MNSGLFFVNYQIFFCGLKACFGFLLWQWDEVLSYSFQVLKGFSSRWGGEVGAVGIDFYCDKD